VPPASVGLSATRLARIDALLSEAIARQEVPGGVVLVGRHGKVAFRKAYGHRALEPAVETMTTDTAFDLASLTKGVATAAAVMTLVEQGRIALDEPVVRYLPEFGAGGGERERVTVEQLLTHRSGLVADDPMSLYDGTPAEIFARKHRTRLASPPGNRFVYSDAGYEVLGELVRAVTGETLDLYARRAVFEPLDMRDTEFRPAGRGDAFPSGGSRRPRSATGHSSAARCTTRGRGPSAAWPVTPGSSARRTTSPASPAPSSGTAMAGSRPRASPR
jgi:Beta-lactamase class C and other penicillin binding proteins